MKNKKLYTSILVFILLDYSNLAFSQTHSDSIAKSGVFIMKGNIVVNNLPLANAEVAMDYFPTRRDHEKKYTKADGSFDIRGNVNNFYKRGECGAITFDKSGYYSKTLFAYLELPKDINKSVFTLEATIELVPKNKIDSLRCGTITWSKEENTYVISWHPCNKINKTHAKSAFSPTIGEKAVLNNIYFETDKSKLLPTSFVELNVLKDYLIKEKGTIIEISGHTDNTGTQQKNAVLSASRAKAVADYLISKGISASRISYRGFGSTKNIAPNDSEEGRQKNRRVEFIIIKK